MQRADLSGKTVLEIGPGKTEHIRFWRGKPTAMTVVDVERKFPDVAREQLACANVPCTEIAAGSPELDALLARPGSFDVMLSFYSLEHIYPLSEKGAANAPPAEARRITNWCNSRGQWVGVGLGRYFTTRRMAFRHGINYDKVICSGVNF